MNKSRLTEKVFFLTLILSALLYAVYLTLTRRIAGNDDAFTYFTMQYYFFNNAVISGELPQWIPYMTQGTTAGWWYAVQSTLGITANALLLLKGLIKNLNFLTIYNFEFFLNEAILLTGIWLWSKHFCRLPAVLFFIGVSVLGSSIWLNQPWFNFYSYYAIPLILHFFHSFLNTGRFRYLSLGLNFLLLQAITTMVYLMPVTSSVIFLYFLFYFLWNRPKVLGQLRAIRLGKPFFLCLAGIAATLITIFSIFHFAKDSQLIYYDDLRSMNGTVSLNTFLNYTGNRDLIKWTELFLGISPAASYTLFIGFIPILFIFYGIRFLNRQNAHLAFIIITLMSFSIGHFPATLFYHLWPFMDVYRHLALISPIIKIFLCLLAGIGLEAFVTTDTFKKHTKGLNYLLFTYAGLAITVISFFIIKSPAAIPNVLLSFPLPKIDISRLVISTQFLKACFFTAFLIGLVFLTRKHNSERFRGNLMLTILIFHLIDLSSYKILETNLRSTALNNEEFHFFDFQPLPFRLKRNALTLDQNPRSEMLKRNLQGLYKDWSTDAFLFQDHTNQYSQTHYWLRPFDQYLRAFWHQPINDTGNKPKGLSPELYQLKFPHEHLSASKASGITKEKIQFFFEAYRVENATQLAGILRRPEYKGDLLLLEPDNSRFSNTAADSPWSDQIPLDKNTRLQIPYQILKFDSNHLEISADVPETILNSWLYYSDVWHPLWKALVNGQSTPVYKANLAYKAVELQPGKNLVHFYFGSKLLSSLQYFIALNSLIWIIIIGNLVIGILKSKEQNEFH